MRFPATCGWGPALVAVGGPSPLVAEGPLSVVVGVPFALLAEGPGCCSSPLLAWVCWWWWCVVPRLSWLRVVLLAVPSHSWLGPAGRGGGGGPFPWGWVGASRVVCVYGAAVCVVPPLFCVSCICDFSVGGGVGGVVWVCLPRVLVCVRVWVWCVRGLWLLVLDFLSWGLLLFLVCMWLVCIVVGPSALLAGFRCRPCWVFPRHSWPRAPGAVPRHSWLGSAGGGGVLKKEHCA